MKGASILDRAKRAYPRFDPESKGYDGRTADELIRAHPLNIPKPKEYQGDVITDEATGSFQAWVWHEDKQEYLLHGASLDPRTGMVLKGRRHSTWNLMEQEELRRGNVIEKIGDRYYSGTHYEMEQKKRILNGYKGF